MKSTKEKTKKEIGRLREFIDQEEPNSDLLVDLIAKRIAYAVECALRWSIEETVGWKTPLHDCKTNARLLLKQITKPNNK